MMSFLDSPLQLVLGGSGDADKLPARHFASCARATRNLHHPAEETRPEQADLTVGHALLLRVVD